MGKNKKDKFSVCCHCVMIGTDIKNIKQYILSTKPDQIDIPKFYINHENLKDLDTNIVTYMQTLVAISDIELTPQLIALHSSHIETKENELNTVYGFVSNYTDSIDHDKVHWIEFKYNEYTPYSYLIAEVTRKLK